MKKILFIAVSVLLLATLANADEFGAGKSNSNVNEIGGINGSGGSVGSAGLGIQADEFSGAATFSVPIPLPPGRGGLAPKLTLNYHSMRKNPGGWLGYGWDLSLGEIVRTPKHGNVDYYTGTEFEVRLLGQTEQLRRANWDVPPAAFGISVKPGTTVDWYIARVDNSRNLYFHLYNKTNPKLIQDLGWVVIDKGGTRYEFSPLNYSLSPDLSKKWVAGWMLDKITDTNGNTVEIEYGIDQHPNKIVYGDIVVQFEKTGFETLRFFPIFREGFFGPQKVSRLDAIEVRQGGNNVRFLRYELVYTESATNRAPLLTSIKRLGKTDAAMLPSITLSYFGNEQVAFQGKPAVLQVSAESGGKDNVFNPGYLGNYADIMDLDGDGRAEILMGFEVKDKTKSKKEKFIVRSIAGGPNYGQPIELQDPLVGHCMADDCWGLVSGVKKFKIYYYDWVFMQDMNGDGAPDRVLRTNSDVNKPPQFLIAFGVPGKLGWDANLVAWADPMKADDPGVEDHSAGLVDLNGDGLPDRIVGDVKTDGFNVYFNTGYGFSMEPVFWKDPRAVAKQPNDTAIAKLDAYAGDKLYSTIRDVTGDGLPDRVYRTEFVKPDGSGASEFGFLVAVNKNGLGWGQPQLSQNPNTCPAGKTCSKLNAYDTLGIADPLTVVADRGYISSSTYDLMDFNNDGFADRVESLPYTGDPATGKIRITYFSGQAEGSQLIYFDPKTTVTLDDPVYDDKFKVWAALGYLNRRHIMTGQQFTMTRDVNGDGYPDRLVWTPRDASGLDAEPYTQRSIEIHPFIVNPLQFSTILDLKEANQPVNALKEINNGEGMKTAVEYIQSTDPEIVKNRYLPTPMTLVHRLFRTDTDAPIDSSPEGKRHQGMRWASYYYEGGNLYLLYGKFGKSGPNVEYQARFNGFQSVSKWYKPMNGETWPAYVVETWFHQAKGDLTGTFATDNSLDPAGYAGIALSGRSYRQEMREGQTLRARNTKVWELAKSKVSDNPDCAQEECRPLLKTTKDEIFESGSAEARILSTSYEYDDEDNVTTAATSANSGSLAVTNTDYYPDSIFKAGSKIRNRVKSRTVSGNGKTYRKVAFDYDGVGNPLTEKQYSDAGSFLTTTRKFGQYGNITEWKSLDGVTHTHTYDPDNVFPVTESITLPGGQVLTTKRGYHRTTGKLTQEIDPHGVGSQMTLDDFGRPVSEDVFGANGNPKPLHQWSYDYLNVELPGAYGTVLKTQMWEAQPGFGMVKQQIAYTDGNGRTRQACSLAENGMYRRIQNLTQNSGRTRMQTVPKFDADDCILLPQLAGATTTSTHDIFGRPIVVQPPAGDVGSPTAPTAMMYITESATGNLIRKTTLSNGTVRTEKINGLGQTVSVEEGTNGTTATYKYTVTGELLSTVIGGQNQMTGDYDWLGRKKIATDADMGAWSYDYDTLGRLKTQIDAKKQKTVFDYDAVGRVTQKQFMSSTGVVEKTEKYFYDVSAGQGFDVLPGELAQVIETTSGGAALRSSLFSYDSSYRRMAKMQRSITGVGDFTQSFVNNFKGQMTSTTYPGGKTVYQTYNKIGSLSQVCGSADCLDYYYLPVNFDAYGAIVNEMFGNGVQVKNDYYPNTHRLQSRTTSRQGKDYAKREYQYNSLSSLTSLSDPLNQLGSSAMSGISFDGQDRLLGYQPKEGAVVAFTYAANGNLLSNSDTALGKTYEYGGPRPHAVTKIGTDTFDYDANGNMVKDASRTMAYSATNQLTQVKMANGGVVDMDYDFTGARVLKKSVIKDVNGKTWQTTTHYLGEAMEVRLAPVELGADGKPVTPLPAGTTPSGTVLLHISANGQRVATMTAGSLSDVLKPAAGTLWGIPFNQLPPLVAFSLLLALLIAFFPRMSLRGLKGRGNPVGVLLFVRSLSKSAKIALLLVIIQFVVPPIALAGDSGTPVFPPSDSNYLVFYHGDHLGSAQLITEGNTKGKHAGITYKRGDVIQRFEYAAYGRESFVLNPNLAWDPAFTGQQYDIETGLYYYRARYYNPILGRFIQPDTLVQDSLDPQSWNRYAYVKNNPLKYTDPTGHEPHFEMSDDYDSFVHGRDRDNDTDAHFSDSSVDSSGNEGGLIGAVAVVSFAINSMTGGHSEQVIGAGKALMEGAAWLLDTLQSFGPKVQLSAEDQTMIDFAMGFSMAGGIRMVGVRAAAAGIGKVARAFRYVGPEEAAFIQKNGFVPNVSRAGTPKQTSLTFTEFSSSSAAEKGLKIGRFDPRGPGSSPTHGVEVDISSAHQSYGGNSAVGSPKVIEIRTGDVVRALRIWGLDP